MNEPENQTEYRPEDFDTYCNNFAERLISNGHHWKDYSGAAYSTRMEECIKNVRAACDQMEHILKLDKEAHKPLRTLTPEEYETKVAAGKKIKLAEGGAH